VVQYFNPEKKGLHCTTFVLPSSLAEITSSRPLFTSSTLLLFQREKRKIGVLNHLFPYMYVIGGDSRGVC
jgi:hypothetical protein